MLVGDGEISVPACGTLLRSRHSMTKVISQLALAATVVCSLMAIVTGKGFGQSPDSATLIQTAVGGSGQARYSAIDDLGERHEAGQTVVPQLHKLLSDTDPQVRWRSARALGDYGSQAVSAVPKLRSLLKDSDPIVEYHAAVTLGKIGDRSDETVGALVAVVTSPDGRVARAAISALRKLDPAPEIVVEALQKVLASDDDAVVLYAIEAITERGGEAAPLLIAALKEPRTAYMACTAIAQIGPDAKATVPAIADLLGKTKHSQVLIQALLALASIGPDAKSAVSQVVPLLQFSTDETVPVAAAYALGSIGASGADSELKAVANSPNAFLQMMAAWALAKGHPQDQMLMKQGVAKLTQGLANDDPMMRASAARCLAELHAPAEMVAPALLALANDPDPHVADNVIAALATRTEEVVPKAIEALKKPEMRKFAARVLARIGPKASAAVGPLAEAAQGADPEFRIDINRALAAIGPEAGAASDVLVEALASDNEGVRHSALFALRQIGPRAVKAGPKLVEKMTSSEGFEQLATAWALASVGSQTKGVAARVAPILRLGLADPDASERLETISVISALGSQAALLSDDLKRLATSDPDQDVRIAASDALKKIGG